MTVSEESDQINRGSGRLLPVLKRRSESVGNEEAWDLDEMQDMDFSFFRSLGRTQELRRYCQPFSPECLPAGSREHSYGLQNSVTETPNTRHRSRSIPRRFGVIRRFADN